MKYRVDLYYKDTNLWAKGKPFVAEPDQAHNEYARLRRVKKADGFRLVQISERVIEARGTIDVPGIQAGTYL